MTRQRALLASAAVVVAFSFGVLAAPLSVAAGERRAPPVVVLSETAKQQLHEDAPGAREPTPESDADSTQQVAVRVEAGPLTILRAPRTVTLKRAPGSTTLRGTVSGLRLVDARGTGAGWRLRMQVAGTGALETIASVKRVVATAASTSGLHPRANVGISRGVGRRLLSADVGSGRGAFDVTLTVEEQVAEPVPDRLTVILQFELD